MEQGTQIKDRMLQFIKWKGITAGWLEKQARLGNGYLRNSSGGFTAVKLAEIVAVCPELNLNWLVTGKGPMTHNNNKNMSTLIGANIQQNQNGNDNLAIGRIGEIVYDPAKKSFFDTIDSLIKLKDIDLDKVPIKFRGLVKEIKENFDYIEQLNEEVNQLNLELRELDKRREAEVAEERAKHDKTNEQLIDAKNQLIGFLLADRKQ